MVTSTTVAIIVSSSRLPEYVLLGLERHKVEPFWKSQLNAINAVIMGTLSPLAAILQRVHVAPDHTSEMTVTLVQRQGAVTVVKNTKRRHINARNGNMSWKYVTKDK